MMNLRTRSGSVIACVCFGLMLAGCGNTGGGTGNDGGNNGGNNGGDGTGGTGGTDGTGGNGGQTPADNRIDLNVTKLDFSATTQRGPAVGDGVLAFDADGGAVLAWVRAGSTDASAVPSPSGMRHDRDAFQFSGRKLVVRDAFSGSLYVFDTDTEQVAALPSTSINLGASIGPNLWEADGNFVATINATVTTENGAGRRIKVADFSDVNNPVITAFDVDPDQTPNAVAIDADGRRVIVRGGDNFYVYDMDSPAAAPTTLARSSLEGGLGSDDIRVRGDSVAFFDNDDNFSVLDLGSLLIIGTPRNPGRSNRGLVMENGVYAYFGIQTDDDGSTISQINRLLVGDASNGDIDIDPAGAFINGGNANDGRVGFGATASVSPNGRFVFVAGETAVGVDESERLYVSIDGAGFLMVDDDDDPLDVMRAAGVEASDNLVAFLIPASLGEFTSNVSVAYVTLPPPAN